MSGKIPRAFIDDLLVRVDIVDLIDSHVPLKKSGSNYMACCPFHSEKSPSFSVNRSKQFYHCFGCGISGNAISFLMDFTHLNFVEAIEELAGFIGIEVPREQGLFQTAAPQNNLKELYLLLAQISQFFAQQLRSSNPQAQPAIAYLKKRGVSGQIAKTFSLGYACAQWDVLAQHFPPKKLLELGLLVQKDDGKHYDRFRNRIMFPIKDKRGRVIGFGGRVLDDSQPKYLNSPESSVFSKGQHVYGLYELLQKQGKPVRILVVEGYLDVIALAQFGLHYAVATLGTATSKTHIDLLFRLSPELVFCFDGDKAGQQAAWRATEAALPSLRDGRQVKIMLLPQGHDPDSLIRAEGLVNFEQRINTAQIFSDYFFTHFTATLDLSTMEGRAKLVAEASPCIGQLPHGVFKNMMAARLQQLAQTPVLDFSQKSSTVSVNPIQARKKNKKQLSPLQTAIALLLQNPHLAESVPDKFPNWESFSFSGAKVLIHLLHTILNHHSVNTGMLVEMYRGLVEENRIKALASWEFLLPESGITAEFLDAINTLLMQAKKAQVNYLLEKSQQQSLSVDEKNQLNAILNHK